MRIEVQTIPKGEDHYCSYPTCGDWRFDHEGILRVTVTESGNNVSDLAVAIHEIIEAYHCKMEGISEYQVTRHDVQFESERITGRHAVDAEPGDDPRAPYREAHQRANHVERAVCHSLDLLWGDHERAIESTQ